MQLLASMQSRASMFTQFWKTFTQIPEIETIPFTPNFCIEFFSWLHILKNYLKNVLCANIQIVWLGVVMGLISIATCADS